MKFTGFMETGDGKMVLTTVGPVELDDLIERLRTRIAELPPGTNVRIDLIAWDEPPETKRKYRHVNVETTTPRISSGDDEGTG